MAGAAGAIDSQATARQRTPCSLQLNRIVGRAIPRSWRVYGLTATNCPRQGPHESIFRHGRSCRAARKHVPGDPSEAHVLTAYPLRARDGGAESAAIENATDGYGVFPKGGTDGSFVVAHGAGRPARAVEETRPLMRALAMNSDPDPHRLGSAPTSRGPRHRPQYSHCGHRGGAGDPPRT